MVEPPVPPRPEPRRMLPPVSLVERLRAYWDDPRVRIGALLVGALVAGLVWYQLGVSGTSGTSTAAPPSTSTTATSAPSSSPATGSTEGSVRSGGLLFVQIAGSVVHPGRRAHSTPAPVSSTRSRRPAAGFPARTSIG